MSSADMRGFRYPLEAIVLRQRWSIDQIQGRIVSLRGNRDDLQRRRSDLMAALGSQALLARTAWTDSPNPTARQRMLGYLAQLQAEKLQLDEEFEIVRKDLRLLEQSLIEEQIRLSALEEHRSGVRGEFVLSQQRQVDTQSDAQWLAVSAWRRGVAERSGQ